MKAVGIVVKPRQVALGELVRKLATWCDLNGLPYFFDEEIASELAVKDTTRILPREQITTRCDPVVVLGGDGTLISVCRYPASPPPIIVGVNAGTLGFLTEITIEELFPTLETIRAGTVCTESRSMLQAEVSRQGVTLARYTALNDIVISKEALARMFTIGLDVSGQHAALLRGDGVIVATPGGSTAYSLSAGGSIVHPQVKAILVTPICPHSLTSRPLVVPADSQITLTVNGRARPTQSEVYLTIDGQDGMGLQNGDVVTVVSSPHTVTFVKSPSRNYFEVLATKLQWATTTISP